MGATIGYICVMVLFVFLSMCFSSSDMAFSAVSITRLERYNDDKNTKLSALALKLAKGYESTISTLLFGNNLVNIGLTSVATIFLMHINEYYSLNLNAGTMSLITTIGVLVILLIFGEIVPKSIVKAKAFRSALIFTYFVRFFQIIFFPLTFVFSNLGRGISFPVREIKDINLTDKELEEMVDGLSEEKLIDEDQAEMLRGTTDFASTEAYEIMTPRVDIYAIDIEDDLEEILKEDELYNFSRIPVYEDSIDNIIGYILTKTLVRMKLEDKNPDLESILIKPLKFPRSTEINNIMREFKQSKNHFAVIYDEYGGVEGILTMEDILVEIVGEIWDESDERNEPFVKLKNGDYIVDGNMNLEDFLDLFDYDIEDIDTEYVTIGGYCIELLDDKFAKVNDVIEFKNLELQVLAVDEHETVEKLKVTVKPEEEDD